MQRIEITRREFCERFPGVNPAPESMGVVFTDPSGSIAQTEYVFTDDVIPPLARKQIAELERIYQL